MITRPRPLKNLGLARFFGVVSMAEEFLLPFVQSYSKRLP